MKGRIVEINGDTAVVFTKSAEFVKTKNFGSAKVGDEITIHSMAVKYYKAVAAAAVIVFAFVGAMTSYCLPVSYVDICINPEIVLKLNMFDVVIGAVGKNDDGTAVLAQKNVKNVSLDKALDDILYNAEELGFIPQDEKKTVVLSVFAKKDSEAKEVYEDVSSYKTSEKINKIVKIASEDDMTKAGEENLSVGKYLLVNELSKMRDDITKEEIKQYSVKDIIKTLDNIKSGDKQKPSGETEVKPTAVPSQNSAVETGKAVPTVNSDTVKNEAEMHKPKPQIKEMHPPIMHYDNDEREENTGYVPHRYKSDIKPEVIKDIKLIGDSIYEDKADKNEIIDKKVEQSADFEKNNIKFLPIEDTREKDFIVNEIAENNGGSFREWEDNHKPPKKYPDSLENSNSSKDNPKNEVTNKEPIKPNVENSKLDIPHGDFRPENIDKTTIDDKADNEAEKSEYGGKPSEPKDDKTDMPSIVDREHNEPKKPEYGGKPSEPKDDKTDMPSIGDKEHNGAEKLEYGEKPSEPKDDKADIADMPNIVDKEHNEAEKSEYGGKPSEPKDDKADIADMPNIVDKEHNEPKKPEYGGKPSEPKDDRADKADMPSIVDKEHNEVEKPEYGGKPSEPKDDNNEKRDEPMHNDGGMRDEPNYGGFNDRNDVIGERR